VYNIYKLTLFELKIRNQNILLTAIRLETKYVSTIRGTEKADKAFYLTYDVPHIAPRIA